MQSRCAERLAGRPVDHELEVDVAVRKVYEVAGDEHRLKFPRDRLGVLWAKTERDESPDIAEDRVSDFRLELIEMLVGQDQADMELPKLGHHVGDGEGRKALELVNEDMIVGPFTVLDICPAERRESDRRHQQRAQKARAVFT